jgi:DNA-binding transcriptional regulator GbsR (MarR family)
MVEKIWKRGVRKDLYKVEEDWYQPLVDLFTMKWRRGVHMNVQAIQKSLQEMQELRKKDHLSENLAHEIDIDIEKLKNVLDYYDWVDRLIDSFESGEIFKYIPRK